MATVEQFFGSTIEYKSVDISNGGTESTALDVFGCVLSAIEIPSAFTGTTISFKGSIDGTTYSPVYDKIGALYSVAVGTSRIIVLDPTITYGLRYIKIVSGSAEGAARNIKCGITNI
jgi:hypothetical protein